MDLISLLKDNVGKPLTPELAADICMAERGMIPLVEAASIKRTLPERCGEFTFAFESMESILDEISPLHRAHWNETEEHRHGLPFNPDYKTIFSYERAGRYVLFTLRRDGRLLGNFSLYLSRSLHTQTLTSKEDTLFLLPEARKGRTAVRFIAFGERALLRAGVREIRVSVKLVNKAGRLFQMIGYKPVESGLSKILEVNHA